MTQRFDAAAFLAGLFAPAADERETDATLATDPLTTGALDEPGGLRTADDLPAPWREWYEHRAAVREYEGGQAREHAEAEALRETWAAMKAAKEKPEGQG